MACSLDSDIAQPRSLSGATTEPDLPYWWGIVPVPASRFALCRNSQRDHRKIVRGANTASGESLTDPVLCKWRRCPCTGAPILGYYFQPSGLIKTDQFSGQLRRRLLFKTACYTNAIRRGVF